MIADIHAHILPGLDDGAVDCEQALKMLEKAWLEGVRHIVATPHFTPACDHGGAAADVNGKRNSADVIRDKVAELNELAAANKLEINIYPGSEVMLHPDTPDIYDTGCICTLNDTGYLLVEFPQYDIPKYADNVFYQLQLKNLTPVIAHPERCNRVIRDPGVLDRFIKRGMLAQVNAASLTGGYGGRVRRTALRLIREGVIQFVASDAHDISGRASELAGAKSVVAKKFGWDVAEKLFWSNAIALLKDKQVEVCMGERSF